VKLEFVHVHRASLVELYLIPILYGVDSSREVIH